MQDVFIVWLQFFQQILGYFGLNTLKIDELCVFGLEKVVTYGDMVICSV